MGLQRGPNKFTWRKLALFEETLNSIFFFLEEGTL